MDAVPSVVPRTRACAGDGSPSGIVLGFGGIEPIHAGPIDEAREADRHLRERMCLASRLQQQNVKTAVLREAMGERRARRSGSNDDEIDRALVHGPGPPVGSAAPCANVTIADAGCRERRIPTSSE